ncbi:hypothetical protein [Lacticaseibacillus zhaodongensis]|uniref:hypothetical protein n=1 Tax=Lacticaseibacillus zhaodongensis TaxID=2668065 RepID=UPI0012D2E28C|nr:hypothetical protein [Lacticaseibacillus zhaodongensis]
MLNFSFFVTVSNDDEPVDTVHYVKIQIPETGTWTLFDMPLQGKKLSEFCDADFSEFWKSVGRFLEDKHVGEYRPEDFFVVQACHKFEFNCTVLDHLMRSGDQEIV